MAIGALAALHEFGLRVPEDVSVVGFDNSYFSRFLIPPLTTVAFDFDLQSRLAFQFLFEQIENPHVEPHQHVLLPELVVRQSTRELDI
jgi:DNA-binding LacI/PurR family transcriptional regulator